MTYAEFLFFFLILPLIPLLGIAIGFRRVGRVDPVNERRHWRGVAILALIAFVWTTPWDNYLIASGVWDSPPERVLARLGWVPIEEYAFFLLMPVFNGAIFLCLLKFGTMGVPVSSWREKQLVGRVAFTILGCLLILAGAFALRDERGAYLGWILLWFTPPLLIQWLFDPRAIFRGGRMIAFGTLLPLGYFGLVDSYAISQGIWVISEQHTTGLGLPNLPMEEFLFFGITSLLLAQGLLLWHSIGSRGRAV